MEPIRSTDLNQQIQDRIKEHIVKNNLRPGDRLPGEMEITRQLGVSRTAVREAMEAIKALGIIEKRSGSGTFVTQVDLDKLLDSFAFSLLLDEGTQKELFDIRKRLELSFLSDVVHSLQAEDFQRLRAILERMRVKAESSESFAQEDIELHIEIFKSVGNETLLKLLKLFYNLYGVPGYDYEQIEGSLELPYRRHKALVDALELGDFESARALLLEDFRHFLPVFTS